MAAIRSNVPEIGSCRKSKGSSGYGRTAILPCPFQGSCRKIDSDQRLAVRCKHLAKYALGAADLKRTWKLPLLHAVEHRHGKHHTLSVYFAGLVLPGIRISKDSFKVGGFPRTVECNRRMPRQNARCCIKTRPLRPYYGHGGI